MTDPNQTLAGLAKQDLAAMMVDKGVPADVAERRVHEKAAQTRFWLGLALAFFLISFGVAGIAVYVLSRLLLSGGAFPWVAALVFGAAAGLPLAGALFCATQADNEFVTKWLDNLLRLRKLKDGA